MKEGEKQLVGGRGQKNAQRGGAYTSHHRAVVDRTTDQ